MKNIILLFVAVIFNLTALGQETQSILTKNYFPILNPAYLSAEDNQEILLYGKYDNSPPNGPRFAAIASYKHSLSKSKFAFGINISTTEINTKRDAFQSGIEGSIAYKLFDFEDLKWSIGTAFGVQKYLADLSPIGFNDLNKNAPEVKFGSRVSYNNFEIGASYNLNWMPLYNHGVNEFENVRQQTVLFNALTSLQICNSVTYKPAIYINLFSTGLNKDYLILSSDFVFNKKFTVGGSYLISSIYNTAMVNAGVLIKNKLQIAAAYTFRDMPIDPADGALETIITFKF